LTLLTAMMLPSDQGWATPSLEEERQHVTEPVTARQFHFSGGVEDGGACAYFPTGWFAEGGSFVGGHVVGDEMAPSWWVLADPEGNEACVATWIGTDGRGYP
jgi:hypothetical protein